MKAEVCKTTIINREQVERIKASLPSKQDVSSLSEIFKVISDPTRLQMALALSVQELCVCDLAAIVNLSVSAISHQLRLLKSMKIVTNRKQGKMVFYKLDDQHIENLIKESLVHIKE